MLKKEIFDVVICPLNAHLKCISMEFYRKDQYNMENLIFFLDSDGANSQIKLSEWCGFFIPCFIHCLILTEFDT